VPMFDNECTCCGLTFEALSKFDEQPSCRGCGSLDTRRVWASHAANMIPDSVPGGFVIENLHRTPTRYFSKSEYRDDLRANGCQIKEYHTGDPGEGSDKPRRIHNPNTGKMERPCPKWV